MASSPADRDHVQNPWLAGDQTGERYAARIARRAEEAVAQGRSPHGEADLVTSLGARTVLDAGCGTGRVAIELARRGVEVLGVDLDPSMLAVAAAQAPELTWVHDDLAALDLDRRFDVAVAAGNVMCFLTPGTLPAVVANLGRHLHPGGQLVAGFAIRNGPGGSPVPLRDYDRACAEAGMALVDRFSTWEGTPYVDQDYAVSIHLAPH